MLKHLITRGLISLLLLSSISGCSSRDERKVEYLSRAQAHFEAQNFEKARIDVRNALQIDENYAEARYLFAQLFEREQNWPQMLGNLNLVLELDPNHVPAKLKYGTLMLAARSFDKASEQAELALAIEPDNAEIYACLLYTSPSPRDRTRSRMPSSA